MIDLRTTVSLGRTFVVDVETFRILDAVTVERSVFDGIGIRTERFDPRVALRTQHRLVGRVLASNRVELLVTRAEGFGDDVSLAIPSFRARRIDAIVVLRCRSPAGRGGCVEIWEPSATGDLVHAEGYYGALAAFELSSRLSHFGRGVGLPGVAWERRHPYLLDDVRTASAFKRSELAQRDSLGLGVGIPIFQTDTLSQVVTLITSTNTPVASAVELWKPDRAHRLWLDEAAYVPELQRHLRATRTTCYMRGEGVVGAAYESGRAVMWSRFDRHSKTVDPEATRMNVASVVAIPTVVADEVQSVLVLRI